MTDFSKTDIRALVQDLYKRLTEGTLYEPVSFTNENPENWYGEQEEHDANYIEDCQQEILHNTYSEKTKAAVRRELEQIGASPDSLDYATFLAVCNGVTRAEIEKTKHIAFLRRDPIIPYQPTDELFASAQSSSDLQSIAKPQAAPQKPALTMAQSAEMYVKFKVDVEANWPAVDAKSRRRGIDWFSILVGPEKDIEVVTFEDFRHYRDLLYKLKKNTPAKVNISDYQSQDDGSHINPKTVKQYFNVVKAFLVWLKAEGYSSKGIVRGNST